MPSLILKDSKLIRDGSWSPHLLSLSLYWRKSCLFPHRWASMFLLSCSPSLLYLVWPWREESDHAAVRHSDMQPCSHTACDMLSSQDERRCPPLRLDDGWARMGAQRDTATVHGAPRWASPAWQLPARSRAPALNRALIIKSYVSVSHRVRSTELKRQYLEGTLLCIWIF